MTKASHELPDRWEDDATACNFLEQCGYKLLQSWYWRKPTPNHKITDDEWSAIYYLVSEWDFGGIAP